MSTIFVLAFTHILAFVAGAFAHRWLAKEVPAPLVAAAQTAVDELKK